MLSSIKRAALPETMVGGEDINFLVVDIFDEVKK